MNSEPPRGVADAIDYSRVIAKFDPSSPLYDLKTTERYMRSLRPFLPTTSVDAILEIGPGNGLVLLALLREGFNAHGIDSDGELVRMALGRGIPVEHVRPSQTLDYLKNRRDKYALVYCFHVLEHISKAEQVDFLRAITASLMPGGHVVIEVPNGASPIASWHMHKDWTHVGFLTVESLEFLLDAAGLEIVRVGGAEPLVRVPRSRLADGVLAGMQKIARGISHTIQRIHFAAELGLRAGLRVPVGWAIIGVGRKCKP